MKNLLQHPQFGEIRINKEKDKLWFCAKDVCKALEYKDTEVALRKLDDDEKLIRKIYASGQNREIWFVNESGLYAMVLRSNKPEARKFRRWVTDEVLPSIREYGVYSTDNKVMERAKKSQERKVVKALLDETNLHLSDSDKKIVASQCRTDIWTVYDVLRGNTQDVSVLNVLYARAMGNKILGEVFYSKKGALQLLEQLKTANPKQLGL